MILNDMFFIYEALSYCQSNLSKFSSKQTFYFISAQCLFSFGLILQVINTGSWSFQYFRALVLFYCIPNYIVKYNLFRKWQEFTLSIFTENQISTRYFWNLSVSITLNRIFMNLCQFSCTWFSSTTSRTLAAFHFHPFFERACL